MAKVRETKDTLRDRVKEVLAEKNASDQRTSTLETDLATEREVTLRLQKDYIDTATTVGELQVENQSLADQQRQVQIERDDLEAYYDATLEMLTYATKIFESIVAYRGPDPLVPRQLAAIVLDEQSRAAEATPAAATNLADFLSDVLQG